MNFANAMPRAENSGPYQQRALEAPAVVTSGGVFFLYHIVSRLSL